MTSEEYNKILDEWETLWKKNQEALDKLSDEMDAFKGDQTSNEFMGMKYKYILLGKEEKELKDYKLPDPPTSKYRE